MKIFTTAFIFLLSAMFLFNSCAPTKEEAMNYNDNIIKEQKKIVQAEKELITAIKENLTKGNTLETILKELSDQINESKKVVEGMEKFDGKTDFKDAMLKFLAAYRDVVDNEYKSWLKNLKIPDEQVTEDVIYQEEELVHEINRKLDKANNEFLEAQKDFAAKYKFKLAEN